MRRVYQAFICLSFLGIFIFNPVIYVAAEDQGLDFSPYAQVTLQYDDNVFLSRDDEKDDFIVTLTPGAVLEVPFDDNLLKLDYHVDINKYMDHSSQDANNHYISGDLRLSLRDVTFNIYDNFSHVFERPSVEDVNRVKREDNQAGVKAKLQMERLGVQVGYENFMRDYKSEPVYEAYDRTDHLYSFMLTHRTFPKTDLLFEYDFNQTRYDESVHSDSDYHQFLVGAMGSLTSKTDATIKAGYQIREYERADEPDFDTGVLYADMTHRFSDKDALKLSLARTAYESTYDTNNYYKVESATAILDHLFTPKLMGFLTGQFQTNSYPRETTEGAETKKRRDKYYSAGAGLRYYLQKWFTLTLKAEHIIRDSNFDIFEYDQNLITFSAKAMF
ncbi:MAG: outer membrane beta-barrel protein [Candidatus Omnitrophota bacterium]